MIKVSKIKYKYYYCVEIYSELQKCIICGKEYSAYNKWAKYSKEYHTPILVIKKDGDSEFRKLKLCDCCCNLFLSILKADEDFRENFREIEDTKLFPFEKIEVNDYISELSIDEMILMAKEDIEAE